MKREHFEWLLRHWTEELYSFVLDPVCQGVSSETRDEWVRLGIISSPTILNVLAQTKNFGRLMQLEIGSEGFVANERPASLTMRLINKAFNLPNDRLEGEFVRHQFIGYSVDFEKLLSHMAEQWGIRSFFWDAPPKGVIIGITEYGIPVVILVGKIDRLLLSMVSYETRDNLDTENIWIIDEGVTRLSDAELYKLYHEGIFFIGTDDFLTEEGEPKWSHDYFDDDPILFHPVGGISDDDDTMNFSLDGEVIEFTESEARIIGVLKSNLGRPVHVGQLMDVLWPDEKDLPDNPLRSLIQLIHYLRKKLEEKSSFYRIPAGKRKTYTLIRVV